VAPRRRFVIQAELLKALRPGVSQSHERRRMTGSKSCVAQEAPRESLAKSSEAIRFRSSLALRATLSRLSGRAA
jgi:hypothetical protein